jgi:hypothetical protein
MPYNPQVADRSGEILGQGVNNGVAQYLDNMRRLQENERKRRTAAGQVQGILAANPTLADKADPTLLQKMSNGKANLNDTLQLLGTLSAVKQQEEEMMQQQMRMVQIQHVMAQMQNQAATQQRAAQRAPIIEELDRLRVDGEKQRQDKVRLEMERLANQQPFSPSIVDLGDGVKAMTTSSKSAVPLQRGTPAAKPGMNGVDTIDLPGVGTVVVDKVTREPLPNNRVVRPPSSGGSKLDPMLVGSLTQRIQALEQEKLEHQQAIVNDDKRYGFLNTSSREERIRQIDQQLAGFKATLGAGGKTSGAPAPTATAAPAPTTEAPGPKSEPKPQTPFYRHEDVQAELRRRGLIK